MKRLLMRLYAVYLGFAAALLAMTLPVRAMAAIAAIPGLPDTRGRLMGIVLIVMGASLAVLIILAALSRRKK